MPTLQATRPCPPAAPWEACLPEGRAAVLEAAPQMRWVQVESGRLWLTRTACTPGPHADHWLSAGERLALPPGSQWVVEGHGGATRYLLLQAPRRSRTPARPARSLWPWWTVRSGWGAPWAPQ